MLKKQYILVLVFLLSGCASIFSGTKDTIAITTPNKNAVIYLNDKVVGKGVSASVIVPKKGDYIIKAVTPNCSDAISPVTRSLDPLTLLGLFIDWGIVSILVVDTLSTGAVTKADNTQVYLNIVCA